MQYEELLVTSSTGVNLAFDNSTKFKCAQMAAAAEDTDTVLGFRIRVLVNCDILKRGDLLTRPGHVAAKKAAKASGPITPGQVVKKIKLA